MSDGAQKTRQLGAGSEVVAEAPPHVAERLGLRPSDRLCRSDAGERTIALADVSEVDTAVSPHAVERAGV